jgi:hypothetical protein
MEALEKAGVRVVRNPAIVGSELSAMLNKT